MRLVLPLNRWLVLSHLVVLALPLGAMVCSGALAKDLARQTEEDLHHQAALVTLLVAGELEHAGSEAELADVAPRLSRLLSEARDETLAGFRVVDLDGRVVASSGDGVGEDISGDPLVASSLAGSPGTEKRPRDPSRSRETPLNSKSRRADYRVFVAEPLVVRGQLAGAVILNRTPREEMQTLWQMAPRLSVGLLVAVGATVALGVAAGHVLSRSLKRLAHASHRIAAGSQVHLAELEGPADSHVAEARELAQAMATMSDRLEERVAYIAEFAGNVSHEFKTPVSALRGTVELLRDDEQMPPEQRARFLDNALADLDRLSRLVGGLLRLARAESAGERQDVDLAAVAARLRERHPELVVAGELGRVRANPEQIEAAIQNLVENAWAHGGEGVHVRLVGFVSGARVGVDVEDDGVGISEANLPRVFDRFFTTGRERGGTGLGLALVRAIARAHGGDVVAESRPGATRFRLWLPRG